MILYACSDLLWATRVKATAEGLGLPARPVRSTQMLADRLGEGGVRGLIVDIDTGELGLELIRAAAASGLGFPIVAFGPHVAADALGAAREAGAHRVIARGAFADRLPQILTDLAAGGSGDPG